MQASTYAVVILQPGLFSVSAVFSTHHLNRHKGPVHSVLLTGLKSWCWQLVDRCAVILQIASSYAPKLRDAFGSPTNYYQSADCHHLDTGKGLASVLNCNWSLSLWMNWVEPSSDVLSTIHATAAWLVDYPVAFTVDDIQLYNLLFLLILPLLHTVAGSFVMLVPRSDFFQSHAALGMCCYYRKRPLNPTFSDSLKRSSKMMKGCWDIWNVTIF